VIAAAWPLMGQLKFLPRSKVGPPHPPKAPTRRGVSTPYSPLCFFEKMKSVSRRPSGDEPTA
jgi:hypothetical protein